jgi:hypothetical protein
MVEFCRVWSFMVDHSVVGSDRVGFCGIILGSQWSDAQVQTFRAEWSNFNNVI